jgi:hypothetical protein
VTEAEWLACADPTPMVNLLRGKATDRKLRLFFCGCCRSVWASLDVPLLRRAVETAERHADGLAGDEQLQAIAREIEPGPHFTGGNKEAAAFGAVGGGFPVWALWAAANLACAVVAQDALRQGRSYIPVGTKAEVRRLHAALLRCIIGLSHRRSPPPPPSAVLAWRDRTVPRLAQAAYDERRLPEGTLDPARLGILGDALRDAGCDDEEVLAHCRSPGPHVRGCWAVDLCLGKS